MEMAAAPFSHSSIFNLRIQINSLKAQNEPETEKKRIRKKRKRKKNVAHNESNTSDATAKKQNEGKYMRTIINKDGKNCTKLRSNIKMQTVSMITH